MDAYRPFKEKADSESPASDWFPPTSWPGPFASCGYLLQARALKGSIGCWLVRVCPSISPNKLIFPTFRCCVSSYEYVNMCLQTTFIQGGIIALVTMRALVVAWCVSARQLVPRPIPARRSSTTHTALRDLMASSAVLPLSVPQRAKQSGWGICRIVQRGG